MLALVCGLERLTRGSLIDGLRSATLLLGGIMLSSFDLDMLTWIKRVPWIATSC